MNFNYIPLYAAILSLAACSPNTRKYLDVKNENGEEVLYRGPMASIPLLIREKYEWFNC